MTDRPENCSKTLNLRQDRAHKDNLRHRTGHQENTLMRDADTLVENLAIPFCGQQHFLDSIGRGVQLNNNMHNNSCAPIEEPERRPYHHEKISACCRLRRNRRRWP